MFAMKGEYFAAHRKRLIDMLKKFKLERSVVLLRSENLFRECFIDIEMPFTQEALFYWLTGWKMANSALVIDVLAKKSYLFVPDYDDELTTWIYPKLYFKEVKSQTHVDEVHYMRELNSVLENINKTSKPLRRFLGYPENPALKHDDTQTLIDVGGLARKVKFDWEIKCLKHASELTSDALTYVMKKVKPGMSEKILEADFLHYGMTHGADGLSFLTTVASGQNASYPHYHKNDSTIKNGSLVVLDCGFYYNHYAGDVTRTFPANGKFSDIQKEMYNKVFTLQMYALSMVKPGVHMEDLNHVLLQWVFNLLQSYGIIDSGMEYNEDIAMLFEPHTISHHIGCNTHDLCMFIDWDQDDTLQKDMIISIEPGIYFNRAILEKAKNDGLPINFDRAFEFCDTIGGIRIEDDVLVTSKGVQILSNAPKTVEEIERAMR